MSADSSHESRADGDTRIMRVADRFDEAWRKGRRPSLEEFLPVGPERRPILIELVHIDLERRLKNGEMACVEAYFACYPDLAEDRAIAIDLIASEYRHRCRVGTANSRDQFLRRFPQFHKELVLRLETEQRGDIPASSCPVEPDTVGRDSLATPLGGANAFARESASGAVPNLNLPEPTLSQTSLPQQDPFATLGMDASESIPQVRRPAWPSVRGYEILGELGRGGMGVVYKARQLALRRLVALKMIRLGALAGALELNRFQVEAQAVARLHHPNIVQIHEVGEQNGLPYFSLELLEGGTLAQKLNGTPLESRQAARFIEILGRAIHAAHQCGIVHRDLKPSNILLSANRPPAENQRPAMADQKPLPFGLASLDLKIADFGLAKRMDEETAHSQVGLLGTPSYMAPEQAEGKARLVGPAADVYSLGAILYELATGRPPFRAATPYDTVLQVLADEPVPPSRLNSRIPRDLETICLKALAKTPAKRYASAEQLANDLACFLAGEPIAARPVGWLEKGVKWARRRPTAAALLAVSVVATAVVAVGSVLVAARLQSERDTAQAQRYRAEVQAAQRALERGLGLCERGDIGEGMLWLARSLEEAPDDVGSLRQNIRASLSGWRRSLHALKLVVPPSSRPLNAAAFSPDGTWFVTGGDDGMVRRWDSKSGELLGSPLAHPSTVQALAVSSDGRVILTGTSAPDNKAQLWDADSGQPTGRPVAVGAAVLAVAFSPDGQTFVTGSADKKAAVWATATGKQLVQFLGHKDDVQAVAFSSDGQTVLTGSKDKTARLWDSRSGQQRGEPLPHAGGVQAVAFSADGKQVLTGCGIGNVQLWDVAQAKKIGPGLRHQAPVFAVAFHPDGKRILSGSLDRTARLWDAATGEAIGQPLLFEGEPRAVAFSPDRATMLTGGHDGSGRLWRLAIGNPCLAEFAHSHPVSAVALSHDGRRLLTGTTSVATERGEVRLWDLETRQLVHAPIPQPFPVSGLSFSADDLHFVVGCGHPYKKKGAANVFDSQTCQPTGPSLPHEMAVLWVEYCPDGTVLTASKDATARIWDVATGKPLKTFVHPEGVLSATMSPDGTTVFTGGDDGVARFWSVATAKQSGPTIRHQAGVLGVAYSPDGRYVLTGSADRTARMWDASTGDLRHVFPHADTVRPVAFSPDGKMAFTGSLDHTGRLWDTANGKPMGLPFRHNSWVFSVAFSPDGSKLITAGAYDQTARMWTAVPPPLEGAPKRISLWIQVITGLELDANDTIQVLNWRAWQDRRQGLEEMGGPPEWHERPVP